MNSTCRTSILSFSASLLLMGIETSCGKKGSLEYETAQMKLTLAEQSAALKTVQAESLAVGNLGYYHNTQKGHLDQLNEKIKSLRAETENLKAEKQAATRDLELLQKELDLYRSKHTR